MKGIRVCGKKKERNNTSWVGTELSSCHGHVMVQWKVGCLQSRCFRLGAWGCNFTVNHDYRRNSRLRRSCECILIFTNIDGLKCIDIGYNFTSTRFYKMYLEFDTVVR